MRRLIKSSCRARSTPLYLIRCETTGEPGATRSLIGRSELVDWCLVVHRVRFACAMDSLCHVSTTRETSRRHVRVRSCPANFGEVDAPCVRVRTRRTNTHPRVFSTHLARAVNAFLKTGPPCRVCPCSPPPDQLSQWARGGLSEVSLGHALTFQSLANFGLS